MIRSQLPLRIASVALSGLLLAGSLLAQAPGGGMGGAAGSGPGGAPGAMPGAAMNGAQPGGAGSGTGPGLSGYSPSYGVPGASGYGSNTATGMSGPAQAYRVPAGNGVGAAGFGANATGMGYGSVSTTFGDTALGGVGGGRYGNPYRPSNGVAAGGGVGSLGGMSNLSRYGRTSTGVTLDTHSLPRRSHAEESVAHVRVILPSKDAELLVNNKSMKKKGTNRNFISPILTPGKRFIYDLEVRWQDKDGRMVERTRSITIEAGSQEVLDFTRPEKSEQTVSRLGRELGLGRDR